MRTARNRGKKNLFTHGGMSRAPILIRALLVFCGLAEIGGSWYAIVFDRIGTFVGWSALLALSAIAAGLLTVTYLIDRFM